MAGVELYFEAQSELSVADYGCLFLDNLNYVTRCRKFGVFVLLPTDSPEKKVHNALILDRCMGNLDTQTHDITSRSVFGLFQTDFILIQTCT